MDINLIGVPLKYGCDVDGVQFGPDTLRDLGIASSLEKSNHHVYDMGNIYVSEVAEENKYKWHKTMKYFHPIRDININLAHMVYSTLMADSFPLVLGGDHSLAIGSISGASKCFDEMAVIWVDAHADINSVESSPSGHIHGMPLAAVMGVGHKQLVNLYYPGSKVKPENVYIIGARDLDPGEVKLAEELDINLYTMDDIEEKGLKDILLETMSAITKSQVDGVHFSFDVDVLDPSFIPGTGTPVKDGIDLDSAKLILKKVLETGLITSMDFVEFNPKLDDKENTSKVNCLELIELIGEYLN